MGARCRNRFPPALKVCVCAHPGVGVLVLPPGGILGLLVCTHVVLRVEHILHLRVESLEGQFILYEDSAQPGAQNRPELRKHVASQTHHPAKSDQAVRGNQVHVAVGKVDAGDLRETRWVRFDAANGEDVHRFHA